MSLFKYGEFFSLHSGAKSNFKIDCDYLYDEEIEALAYLVSNWIPYPIGNVEGVPTGGLRFAAALAKYCTPGASKLVIVDDVLTTGKSMEDCRAGRDALGIVIFARTSQLPHWITTIFSLHQGMQFRSMKGGGAK